MCVAACAVCLVWHAEHLPRVYIRNALRMYKQHVHMFLTCWRFAGKQGHVLNVHTGVGFIKKTHGRVFLHEILLVPILMNFFFISLEISLYHSSACFHPCHSPNQFIHLILCLFIF